MTGGGPQWRIGPYVVEGELGAGGMGRVLLARSPGGYQVAVKLLRPEFAASAEYRRRFATEVAAAKSVVGVFTAPVVDADPFGPVPWLATAYVPGPTLEALVRGGGVLDEPALRALAAGLAEALAAIHGAGVVHRDLKPGNVLMSAQGPRVIDFGISKDLAFNDVDDSVPLGSVGYAAPEQVTADQPVGEPCDVFALGAVLVFAASGHAPFGDASPQAYAYRVLHEQADLSALPESMRPAVESCLSTAPADRPSPADLLTILAPPMWQSPLATPPTMWLTTPTTLSQTLTAEPGGHRFSRRTLLTVAGFVATGGGVSGLVAALGSGTTSKAPTTRTPGTPSSKPAAPLPNGPAPVWAATPNTAPNSAAASSVVQVVGKTVLWYPLISVNLDGMLAFDAATGRQVWSNTSNAPALAAATLELSNITDNGVYGSADVIGLHSTRSSVFELDASGRQTASCPISFAKKVWGVWGDVVVISSTASLTALSLSDGSRLWSGAANPADQSPMIADSKTVYYGDQNHTYAYDLHSGTQKWRTQISLGPIAVMYVGDSTLIITGTEVGFGVTALDLATGKQLWSTAKYAPMSVYGSRVYAMSTDSHSPIVVALDAASGRVVWTFTSPVPPSRTLSLRLGQIGGSRSWASDKILAVPYGGGINRATPRPGAPAAGFFVLDAATGEPIWAHKGSPDVLDNRWLDWPAAVSGDTVYAATATTIYAFKAGS